MNPNTKRSKATQAEGDVMTREQALAKGFYLALDVLPLSKLLQSVKWSLNVEMAAVARLERGLTMTHDEVLYLLRSLVNRANRAETLQRKSTEQLKEIADQAERLMLDMKPRHVPLPGQGSALESHAQ